MKDEKSDEKKDERKLTLHLKWQEWDGVTEEKEEEERKKEFGFMKKTPDLRWEEPDGRWAGHLHVARQHTLSSQLAEQDMSSLQKRLLLLFLAVLRVTWLF